MYMCVLSTARGAAVQTELRPQRSSASSEPRSDSVWPAAGCGWQWHGKSHGEALRGAEKVTQRSHGP